MGRGDVTEHKIRFAVKFAATSLRYPDRGIPINRVDTHSFRSGGVWALKLAGYDDMDSMKMGRWAPNSTAFMEYIDQQLSTFSMGMAEHMSNVARFTNIKGSVTNKDLHGATVH